MKRILAVFLTLAMALNIAPVAAFAAADSDAASIVAVEETDETSSPQLDEETAKAIASDPFLQAAHAQTEQEQTQQKATSEMSVTGTNSLGKLLVNGIEEQNGASSGSTSRVTKLKMDGSTAKVTFVTESAADLVVAVYTDSTAEEMVASGTVKVFSDDTSASVAIQGEFPEYYTVKAFLLAQESHEPLSPVYTDQSNNEAIKDLENATADKFPEDRVIQLDNQDTTTNFAVVNDNTTLVTYENNTDDRNQVIEADDDGLEYIIRNPDESIRSLQPGRILTYEYEPGQLLIVRVKSIEVEDNRVTIQGDDDLELTDVFDVLKLEESAGSGEFIHSDEGMDPAVEYLGVHEDTTDQTNKVHIEDGGITDTIPIVDTNVHDFKVDGSGKSDAAGSLTAKVTGTLSLNVNMDFAYFISAGRQYALLSDEVNLSGSVSVSGAVKTKFPLGLLHTPQGLKKLGVEAEITPDFVVEVTAKFSFKFQYSQYTEYYYSNTLPNGYEDRSEPGKGSVEPVKENGTSTSVEIQIFVGVEIGPKIDALDKLHMECKLKGGGQVTLKRSDPGDGIKHDCAICFDISMSVVGKLTISLIIWKKDLTKGTIPAELKFLDIKLGDFYWSLDYDEFGADHCPHLSYRVRTQLDGISKAGITIYERDYTSDALHPTTTKLGTTDANGTFDAYLKPGWHELVAVVNQDGEDKEYSGQVTLEKKPTTLVLKTKAGTVTPNPNPDTPDKPGGTTATSGTCGTNLIWKLDDEGVLTISGTGEMYDYDINGICAPWYKEQKKIIEIKIEEGVKSIGNDAFYNCNNVAKVSISDSVKRLGQGSFEACYSLKNISIPNGVTKIENRTFESAGLTEITIPNSVTSIGDGAFSGCWFSSVVIPDSVTSIGVGAFNCDYALVSVEIPSSVVEIGENAFAACRELVSVTLPDSITKIADRTFDYCEKLSRVTLSKNTKSIGIQAFSRCSSLTSIIIPDGVMQIKEGAFEECGKLASVAIPGTVTEIGNGVFRNCTGLKKSKIADGVLSIGAEAFRNCTSLTDLVLPESITNIGDGVFQGCTSLTHMTIPGKVTGIKHETFRGCGNLESVSIPQSVLSIGHEAFYKCDSLKDVYYSGAKNAWNTISISYDNDPLSAATIHCTDGDILPTSTASENSITTGTASTSDSKFQATFANAKAGKEYVVLVSRSGSDPLNADNLIYINQITADADGELAVPFITAADAAEMTYVVACAQDGAPVNPDQPGGDEPSSGDDGGGAAIILIGGVAAVAAVAGVVLLMPVKVEGTVKLADQPVANATVQMLKGDAVKAETVTDANGHFTVKVKRGGYTLRVQWTDASGQPVTRTVDFKAPNANLNVAA